MNQKQLRAQLLQVPSPLAERLAAIGAFQIELDCGYQKSPYFPHGCHSRSIIWHRPSILFGGLVPFDLEWSVIHDHRAIDLHDLDPDEKLFALWNRYAPTHIDRTKEFERLMADQHRCWFGVGLPEGVGTPEELWCTVAEGLVRVSQNTLRGEVRYSLQVEFKTEWMNEGEIPIFVWDDMSSQFITPSPDSEKP